jgi:hypothetical protein
METEATLRRGGWRVRRDVAARPGGSAGAHRRIAAADVPGAQIAPADTEVARPGHCAAGVCLRKAARTT